MNTTGLQFYDENDQIQRRILLIKKTTTKKQATTFAALLCQRSAKRH